MLAEPRLAWLSVRAWRRSALDRRALGLDPDLDVFAVEPGALLICGDRAACDRVRARLAPRADVMTTDLSSAKVAFDLDGPDARDTLQAGSPLDLSLMEAGASAGALLWDIPVLLGRGAGEGAWRVVCDRPVAHALRKRLAVDV